MGTFTGKLADDGNLKGLNGVFKNTASGYTTLYLGFIEGASSITDTTDLSGVDEVEGVTRTNITSALGNPAVDGGTGKPTIKNTSQINTANATAAETITGFFITNTLSGDGDLIAYGNLSSGTLNTNVDSPVTIDIGGLVIAVD